MENAPSNNNKSAFSNTTQELMAKLGMTQGTNQPDEVEETELKIFYCSRTHSQLGQFVNELRRVKIPPPFAQDSEKHTKSQTFKHVALGSRKNLCINEKVLKLGNITAINERCIELQSAEQKCPYVPTKDNEAPGV